MTLCQININTIIKKKQLNLSVFDHGKENQYLHVIYEVLHI